MEVVPGIYIGSLNAVSANYHLILNLSGVEYYMKIPTPVIRVNIDDKILSTEDDVRNYLSIFERGAEIIEEAHRGSGNGLKILVHCAAGINRSATVIAFWLVRNGYGYAEAIEALEKANKHRDMPVLTNPSFRDLVRTYAAIRRRGGCQQR